MPDPTTLTEPALAALAARLAAAARPGDCVALHGDLGAGKTTFARAFIRALIGDPHAEVPSPTFPIEQIYDTPRGVVAHYDLYRLSGPDELADLGFEERAATAIVLIEWPDRAGYLLPPERTDITLTDGATAETRTISMRGALADALDMQGVEKK